MMICAWLVVTDVYSEATDAAAGPPRGDGCARTETQSACYAEAPVAMLPSTRGRKKTAPLDVLPASRSSHGRAVLGLVPDWDQEPRRPDCRTGLRTVDPFAGKKHGQLGVLSDRRTRITCSSKAFYDTSCKTRASSRGRALVHNWQAPDLYA